MERQLRQAVSILKEGGVVAYPTDTVYGLGADAFNEEAIRRIYRIKKRPLSRPLSILIADMSDLVQVADNLSEMACLLTDYFWPGGLTIVVSKKPLLPEWLTAGVNTVAVRIPDNQLARDLIRSLGSPLIGTSANLSGYPSITSADDVRAQIGDAVDFIIDGGVCLGGAESTIVDVTGGALVVLREGAISRDAIAKVTGFSPGAEGDSMGT